MGDAGEGGGVGLVYMDALDGAAEGLGGRRAGGLAANGVVKDEDLGGSGSRGFVRLCCPPAVATGSLGWATYTSFRSCSVSA